VIKGEKMFIAGERESGPESTKPHK